MISIRRDLSECPIVRSAVGKELDELREQLRKEMVSEEERRKRMKREYLEWWLSHKKEK